jgi:hypothetical protein
MKERVDRSDDERLYQPRIHSQRIRSLYLIRQQTGTSMTVLVDRAIAELLARYEADERDITSGAIRPETGS